MEEKTHRTCFSTLINTKCLMEYLRKSSKFSTHTYQYLYMHGHQKLLSSDNATIQYKLIPMATAGQSAQQQQLTTTLHQAAGCRMPQFYFFSHCLQTTRDED